MNELPEWITVHVDRPLLTAWEAHHVGIMKEGTY